MATSNAPEGIPPQHAGSSHGAATRAGTGVHEQAEPEPEEQAEPVQEKMESNPFSLAPSTREGSEYSAQSDCSPLASRCLYSEPEVQPETAGSVVDVADSGQAVKSQVSGQQHQSLLSGLASRSSVWQYARPLMQPAATGREDRLNAPVVKLSHNLLSTYNGINDRYYQQKQKDDKNWNYIVRPGDTIGHGRYKLVKILGKGSYGQVVRAIDTHRGDVPVAIKIIKNKVAYTQQAEKEVQLLLHLNGLDLSPTGCEESNIVQLQEHFVHKDHMCLVFEQLSINLYELLQVTKFCGVSLNLVREFAIQIATSLKVLAHFKIIHCDLKPENVLLRESEQSAIKVIDFGISCREGHQVQKYIQSRWYRAPEVIMGIEYTVAIDVWSLGCLLFEMHTGQPLFGGSNEREQLRLFVETLGPLPTTMLERASATKRDALPQDATATRDIADILRETKLRNSRQRHTDNATDEDYLQFQDIIMKMLIYEPAERITPSMCLRHPFLCGSDSPCSPPSADVAAVDGGGGSATTQCDGDADIIELKQLLREVAFDDLDTDGDQVLSMEDLKEHLPAAMAVKIMEMGDVAGTGALAAQDFDRVLKRLRSKPKAPGENRPPELRLSTREELSRTSSAPTASTSPPGDRCVIS
eukprot:COSAG06_NODE_3592_length_5143_cov_3.329104_4_plen_640_part_00